ncbi:mite allergen Lep d 7-like [Centruroides vittatus]|uniref:mite allergen Lep d 7-like n=1 Tax=Centruroides vittatus TaxID=120091 RepID=UPI00350F506E
MKMFSIFAIISLFLLYGGKCSDLQKRGITESNQYIDGLIESTKAEFGHKIEPYLPEDISYEFERKVMFVTFNGQLLFKDMSISGITSVYRDGDSKMTKDNDVKKIICNLGMGVLELDSDVKLSFMKMGYTLKLQGEIGHVSVHVESIEEPGKSPKIDKVEIYDMKGVEARLSGLGPMNYMLNQLIEISLKVFKGKVKAKLENKLQEVFEDTIKNTTFPEY